MTLGNVRRYHAPKQNQKWLQESLGNLSTVKECNLLLLDANKELKVYGGYNISDLLNERC